MHVHVGIRVIHAAVIDLAIGGSPIDCRHISGIRSGTYEIRFGQYLSCIKARSFAAAPAAFSQPASRRAFGTAAISPGRWCCIDACP